jgi:hypothetical protein
MRESRQNFWKKGSLMNDTTGPAFTESSNAQSTTARPWLRWVLFGCGGVSALLIVFVVVILVVVKQVTAAPEEVVQTFISEAAAGNLEAAHDCFSAPLKEVQPFDQFAAGVNANQHLFDIADTSFTNRSVDMGGAEFEGTVTLNSGTEVPCSFKLVRENDTWKLISYNIGSGAD